MATRVLIADDDPATMGTLTNCCKTLRADEVQSVGDGGEVPSLAAQPFDIYMLAQNLPGVPALDLLRQIRQTQPTAPVVLLTQSAGKEYVVEAVQAGASDFITKPIEEGAAVTKLRSWFQLVGHSQKTGEAESSAPEPPPPSEPSESQTLLNCMNPFVSSVRNTFRTMFSVDLVRGVPYRSPRMQPPHEVTGVIQLTGKATGTAAFSIDRYTAYEITGQMLGERVHQINASVRDATGELANIVTGGAKSQLESLQLQVSLPKVLIGRHQTIDFPTDAVPIAVPFDNPWGEMTLMFALVVQGPA